jgi:ATP-dependent Lhr-like helicase
MPAAIASSALRPSRAKRGAHLAISLERLDALNTRPAQRIGLSATVQPHAEVARFLRPDADVAIVAPTSEESWDLSVVVPVPDMTAMGEELDIDGSTAADPRRTSIWPHVEERVVDLITAERSSIVFANSRGLAERLTGRLNEVAEERDLPLPLARAHHGSVSRETAEAMSKVTVAPARSIQGVSAPPPRARAVEAPPRRPATRTAVPTTLRLRTIYPHDPGRTRVRPIGHSSIVANSRSIGGAGWHT